MTKEQRIAEIAAVDESLAHLDATIGQIGETKTLGVQMMVRSLLVRREEIAAVRSYLERHQTS